MLRPVHEDEIGRAARFDQPAVELSHPRRVAGGKAERDFCRHIAQRAEHGHHADDAKRLHTRTGRRIGTQDDARQVAHLARGAERIERRPFVAIVHDLETSLAALADAADLRIRERRMTAIDVADHIRARLQHHIGIDEAGAGDRGSARVNGRLDAVFARPAHHALGRRAILDATKADFPQQCHAGLGQLGKIVLFHARLDTRRAGNHLDAARTESRKSPLRGYRQRLQADDVARPSGGVNLAGRNHAGDAAMQRRIDPTELVLPRRPVACDRMHMAIDEARGKSCAHGIDDGRGAGGIDILGPADGDDPAMLACYRVGIEYRVGKIAAQQQPDIADDQFASGGRSGRIVGHEVGTFWRFGR